MAEAIVWSVAEIGMRRVVRGSQNLPVVRYPITDGDLFAKQQTGSEFRSVRAVVIQVAVMHRSADAELDKELFGDIQVHARPP